MHVFKTDWDTKYSTSNMLNELLIKFPSNPKSVLDYIKIHRLIILSFKKN